MHRRTVRDSIGELWHTTVEVIGHFPEGWHGYAAAGLAYFRYQEGRRHRSKSIENE
jgi:hypothetical protein